MDDKALAIVEEYIEEHLETSLSFDPLPPEESVLRCKFDAFEVYVTDLDSNSIINGCDAGGKIGGWTITE